MNRSGTNRRGRGARERRKTREAPRGPADDYFVSAIREAVSGLELERLLAVLELDGLPDRSRLQQHFSRLLKRYHPDHNRDRTDWAHEKTRAVIAANHRLRKFLDAEGALAAATGSETAGQARAASARDRPWPFSAARDDRTAAMAEGFAVQLLRTPAGRYALPVPFIERILAQGPGLCTSLVPGEYLALFKREVYRVLTPEGEPPRGLPDDGYLVLLASARARLAIVVDAQARFESIEECSPADLRRSFLDGRGELQFFFQTERFVFPARLRRML